MLCLLGVTFHIGAGRRKAPDIAGDSFYANSTATPTTNRTLTATSIPALPTKVGGLTQAWHKLRKRGQKGSGTADAHPGSSTSFTRVTVGVSKDSSGQHPSIVTGGVRLDAGVPAATLPSLPTPVASGGDELDISVTRQQVPLPSSLNPTVTTEKNRQRSVRSVWQAGPCDVTDSEQVCLPHQLTQTIGEKLEGADINRIRDQNV